MVGLSPGHMVRRHLDDPLLIEANCQRNERQQEENPLIITPIMSGGL
jgi:hypothetical protein